MLYAIYFTFTNFPQILKCEDTLAKTYDVDMKIDV